MRRLLYLFALSAMTVLMLAPAAFAQDPFDCGDFQFQEDAQAEFNRDPSDPSGLDEDAGPDDGIACENLPSRGTAPEQPKEEVKTETKTETKTEQKEEKQKQKEEKQKQKEEKKTELPKTGGPGSAALLALGAGTLLVGGGLLIRRIK